ncbi:hypothetical protein AVEN_271437-1 [Araneus ventricosus]|uniref:RNase H type-1 domain-containing protein n=1 Tax=Araneus ventricosus TaxID=182803 RepID=A0A4Y2R3F7_ARAVE|nr:hypothetical protein AVEN_271437-1 [Araneus ventricosus]
METYIDSWRQPGTITQPNWDTDSTSTALSIYTDGSKLNNQVGAAFCIFEPEGVNEYLYRLEDHNSVFQAEFTAFHQALQWKKKHRPDDHCHIYSDSLSALKAIQKLRPKNNLVEKFRDLCDTRTSLHWVKAHIEVAGNEAADRAAKKATEKSVIDVHLGSQRDPSARLCANSSTESGKKDGTAIETGDKRMSSSRKLSPPVAEKEKLSARSLAERSHVGIKQISELLKDKEGIRKMWVLNSNENLKFRKTETSEIDEVLMKWFRSARAKNIPVSGVLFQEKTRELGESLGLETFKASHKWIAGKIPDTSQQIF